MVFHIYSFQAYVKIRINATVRAVEAFNLFSLYFQDICIYWLEIHIIPN